MVVRQAPLGRMEQVFVSASLKEPKAGSLGCDVMKVGARA